MLDAITTVSSNNNSINEYFCEITKKEIECEKKIYFYNIVINKYLFRLAVSAL